MKLGPGARVSLFSAMVCGIISQHRLPTHVSVRISISNPPSPICTGQLGQWMEMPAPASVVMASLRGPHPWAPAPRQT